MSWLYKANALKSDSDEIRFLHAVFAQPRSKVVSRLDRELKRNSLGYDCLTLLLDPQLNVAQSMRMVAAFQIASLQLPCLIIIVIVHWRAPHEHVRQRDETL